MKSIASLIASVFWVSACMSAGPNANTNWDAVYARGAEAKCVPAPDGVTFHESTGSYFICVKGPIEDSDVRVFIDEAGQIEDGRNVFVFADSPGGSGNAAIEFVLHISQHNYRLTVKNRCLSACANYLLPAAHQVFVTTDAKLGWHGGFPKTRDELIKDSKRSLGFEPTVSIDQENSIDESWAAIQEINRQQDAIFAINNVDLALVYEAYEIAYRCTYRESQTFQALADYDGGIKAAHWTPSAQLMRYKYGLETLFFEDPIEFENATLTVRTNSDREMTFDIPRACVDALWGRENKSKL